MVGASPNWNRPELLRDALPPAQGFRVIPVNPRALDEPILGETVYPDLESIPIPVDVVDVFRRPEEVPEIAQSAVKIGAKVLWLHSDPQPRGRDLAGLAGLTFVEDRCMKIEYGRLSSVLAWSGINTRIISSRRGRPLGCDDLRIRHASTRVPCLSGRRSSAVANTAVRSRSRSASIVAPWVDGAY